VTQQGPHFTLYSRSYCHLCEDMLAALRAFMAHAGLPFSVDVVDVDADPQLTDMFDELVPVLYTGVAPRAGTGTGTFTGTGATARPAGQAGPMDREICHYFLDEGALQRYLTLHQAQA